MKVATVLQSTGCVDIRGFRVLFVSLITLSFFCQLSKSAGMSNCYTPDGRPQRCLPPFENAAFRKTITASNTCGTPAERYCVQTGVTGVTKSCHICDSQVPSKSHSSAFLTDLNDDERPTWWQSSTMLRDVQAPNMVNLTLNLHKAFDITYVRLRFHTSRPESFAIYKKKCEDCDWQPFQYYSGSCFRMYGIDNKEIVTVENEQKALCTDDFSDISPLTGGNVAFSTLESRPSAYNFDRSPVLQDWVKTWAIRITLNRINTFGDEVFNDPKILSSYYYGISDLSVGGRCTCNGHASVCDIGEDGYLQCECQHNTAGRNCERCAPMFNDRPWARATRDDPGECKACECNGKSETCYFNVELYRSTGHGGHCTGCRDNTDGPRCEFCQPQYYRDERNRCTACQCDAVGAVMPQCDENGRCTCKPGVGGERCDQCLEGFYGLSEGGCRNCQCSNAGTVEGSVCNPETGFCVCKLNVEGKLCDRCKPATMNLQQSNPYGCTSCFCFGQSSVCSVSNDYTIAYILSEFTDGLNGWTGRDFNGDSAPVYHNRGKITMRPGSNYLSYFVAPGKFLGVQRFSYNQFLEFELSVQSTNPRQPNPPVALPSRDDIILEGYGFRVAASITSQGNPVPTSQSQLYRFRLHEAADFYPRLSALDFQKMLNSLDKIMIRSTYGEGLLGHLDNVQLTSAEYRGSGSAATWVEECYLDGYDGQFTERCSNGYTRDPPNGGVYAPCVPCMCNDHADQCDPDTGVCECQHSTTGDHCELCADGFFFSGDQSKRGTPLECQSCPCPARSSCIVIDDGSVVCTNCPAGHAGKQCEICMDGWFGDPLGIGPCLRCQCSGNIDENAVMNCDRTTGECLKCIHNTTGFHCENCLDGYFGSPTSNVLEEQCQLCECHHLGSQSITSCNSNHGQCECLPNVEGRRCERCRHGYWNIAGGQGCESCNCNGIGSRSGACDLDSGQCDCLPGVTGQTCDRCSPNYYGLSRRGCTDCNCNPDGSTSLQCNEDGVCVCKEGVYGPKCDLCQENYYDLKHGCLKCPTCYSLVQDAVNIHRKELRDLEDMIDKADELPEDNKNNADFKQELDALNDTAYQLLERALDNQKIWTSLEDQYKDTIEMLNEMLLKITIISEKFAKCNETVGRARELNTDTKTEVESTRTTINNIQRILNQAMNDLNEAQRIADENMGKENNMTELAREAQALAVLHKATSKDIVNTAEKAFNTSKKARDSIQEAIDLMDDLLTKLDDLINSENKIPAARKLREDLITQSVVVKNDTKMAKDQSTNLLTEVGKLEVPTVDTESLNRRSEDVLSEVEEIMPTLDSLEREYVTNYAELRTDADKARQLLDLAVAAEQTAEKLLAQVDTVLYNALDAVKRGNDSYKEVLEIIKTLEGFDEEIRTNMEEANEAMQNVDEIERKIREANNLTAEARRILGAARDTAEEALQKAQQAVAIADDVARLARTIRDEAEMTHTEAGRISETVDSLSTSLDAIGEQLDLAEIRAENDKSLVTQSQAGAGKAKKKAMEAEKKVDEVLRLLQDLLNHLSSQVAPDDEELKRLEDLYVDLSDEVEDAGMEEVIQQLEKALEEQRAKKVIYMAEISKLRMDIENLSDINATLPQTCSRDDDVEQP